VSPGHRGGGGGGGGPRGRPGPRGGPGGPLPLSSCVLRRGADMAREMEKEYHPQVVEAAWDAWWTAKGFYRPDVAAATEAGEAGRFVIVIPPPNVTGSLHLGHALTSSVQDCMTRFNRMLGKPTLWLPGTDHAGIATQAVVERRLMKERSVTRHDLGRDAFVKEVSARLARR
jgi:valyl-tRNA synthetase